MDPITILGAAGSAIGIASFGLQLAQGLATFISDVGSAADDLHAILENIKSASKTMEHINGFLEEECENLARGHKATLFSAKAISDIQSTTDECVKIFWRVEALVINKHKSSELEARLTIRLRDFKNQIKNAKDKQVPVLDLDQSFAKAGKLTFLNRLSSPFTAPKLRQYNEQLHDFQAHLTIMLQVFTVRALQKKPGAGHAEMHSINYIYAIVPQSVADLRSLGIDLEPPRRRRTTRAESVGILSDNMTPRLYSHFVPLEEEGHDYDLVDGEGNASDAHRLQTWRPDQQAPNQQDATASHDHNRLRSTQRKRYPRHSATDTRDDSTIIGSIVSPASKTSGAAEQHITRKELNARQGNGGSESTEFSEVRRASATRSGAIGIRRSLSAMDEDKLSMVAQQSINSAGNGTSPRRTEFAASESLDFHRVRDDSPKPAIKPLRPIITYGARNEQKEVGGCTDSFSDDGQTLELDRDLQVAEYNKATSSEEPSALLESLKRNTSDKRIDQNPQSIKSKDTFKDTPKSARTAKANDTETNQRSGGLSKSYGNATITQSMAPVGTSSAKETHLTCSDTPILQKGKPQSHRISRATQVGDDIPNLDQKNYGPKVDFNTIPTAEAPSSFRDDMLSLSTETSKTTTSSDSSRRISTARSSVSYGIKKLFRRDHFTPRDMEHMFSAGCYVTAFLIKRKEYHQIPSPGNFRLRNTEIDAISSGPGPKWWKDFCFLDSGEMSSITEILKPQNGFRRTLIRLKQVRKIQLQFWRSSRKALVAIIINEPSGEPEIVLPQPQTQFWTTSASHNHSASTILDQGVGKDVTYAVYSVHPKITLEKSDWLWAHITPQLFDKVEIIRRIEELNKRGESVIAKKSRLEMLQQEQIRIIIDARNDADCSTLWTLAQLDLLYNDSKNSQQPRSIRSMTVYLEGKSQAIVTAEKIHEIDEQVAVINGPLAGALPESSIAFEKANSQIGKIENREAGKTRGERTHPITDTFEGFDKTSTSSPPTPTAADISMAGGQPIHGFAESAGLRKGKRPARIQPPPPPAAGDFGWRSFGPESSQPPVSAYTSYHSPFHLSYFNGRGGYGEKIPGSPWSGQAFSDSHSFAAPERLGEVPYPEYYDAKSFNPHSLEDYEDGKNIVTQLLLKWTPAGEESGAEQKLQKQEQNLGEKQQARDDNMQLDVESVSIESERDSQYRNHSHPSSWQSETWDAESDKDNDDIDFKRTKSQHLTVGVEEHTPLPRERPRDMESSLPTEIYASPEKDEKKPKGTIKAVSFHSPVIQEPEAKSEIQPECKIEPELALNSLDWRHYPGVGEKNKKGTQNISAYLESEHASKGEKQEEIKEGYGNTKEFDKGKEREEGPSVDANSEDPPLSYSLVSGDQPNPPASTIDIAASHPPESGSEMPNQGEPTFLDSIIEDVTNKRDKPKRRVVFTAEPMYMEDAVEDSERPLLGTRRSATTTF